ncbi:hypothetical protein G7Y89_g2876 [Cudoniella acicularis]|uniref:Carboxymuconolactone decarboxylase-like domain-containing protein n=1 Tax=Cudoniella acicularis TaxID=354080 RepID=A0A8H4W885_9HELO|nr:hypothetical protein G7Y89_g2876 [Cudoniella acicularis]
MKEEGIERKEDGREAEREVLKERFTRKRGYWHAFWEEFLLLDPEFFEAYSDFSSVPWEVGGVLEPKVKELIYCAFDAAATHLYQPGLKLHMKNAIKYGATPEEIMEVLEIATHDTYGKQSIFGTLQRPLVIDDQQEEVVIDMTGMAGGPRCDAENLNFSELVA